MTQYQTRIYGSTEERFWPKVDVRGSDECWEWTAAKNPHGYGLLKRHNHASPLAHRVSWVLHNGPIPAGMLVCHRCDNPPCVNPGHLFLGTVGDNVRDAWGKGRGKSPRRTKLTEDDVRAIRAAHADGVSWHESARMYGMTKSGIQQIVQRRRWKHVT